MPHTRAAPLLPSFWMGGYEGADHVNGSGEALDLVRATGHDRRLDADYRSARRLGLRCVRESIGWRLSERPGGGEWDLSRAVRMAEAARRQGVQILWTLMHYGVPPDLTLLDPALVPRFARFAAEVARVLAPLCPGPRIYTPVNEISFLSWAASATGDMGPAGLQPRDVAAGDTSISGFLIKQRLVRAALGAMTAIRAADPAARFMHVEPVVHVAPRDGSDPDQRALARRISSYQWQALDMLAGRMEPQLGGRADALDWIGLNHYHTSQWEVPGEKRLAWHRRDPRREPLSALLHEVWRRYRRPLVIAETGHVGVGRAAWLHEVAGEALRARAMGVPLQGVCLYPLLDRPDWNDTQCWHRSGLWHVPAPGSGPGPARRLNRPFAAALQAWRGLNAGPPPAPPIAEDAPGLLVLLPCAWEDWAVPRELLLQAWRAAGALRLLEPPRRGPVEPLLRRHTLAPGAELLVLHGGHADGHDGQGGWAMAPTTPQLRLLQQALAESGSRRWLAWLAGWRAGDDPGWWRALDGAGLVVQPDADHPPGADLMRRARACLPAGWPGLVCTPRAAAPHGFEDEEIGRLLRGIAAPRAWLTLPQAPGGQISHQLARQLGAAARRQPATQFVVDANEPPSDEPGPPNLHWLGPVHESLHAGLAAQMQCILRWDGHTEGTGFDGGNAMAPAQLAALVARTLRPLLEPAPPSRVESVGVGTLLEG